MADFGRRSDDEFGLFCTVVGVMTLGREDRGAFGRFLFFTKVFAVEGGLLDFGLTEDFDPGLLVVVGLSTWLAAVEVLELGLLPLAPAPLKEVVFERGRFARVELFDWGLPPGCSACGVLKPADDGALEFGLYCCCI